MSKKKKLIPELRFPDFKNEGEWTEKKISELGETINGLTGKNGEDFGTGKSYVTYKQVFDNSVIDFQKCGKVEIDENENQNTLQKGDILFTTSSETPNEVGFASVLVDSPKEDIYLNSFCFALRPFELEKTQPHFSRYLFHSPIYRKSVSAIAQGSTRYNLSKVAFLNLKVPISKPKEQQKIASCLSFLDKIIEAHSQKLKLLKDHKKGLMQNLFPQEDEKVPKYRFKEFVKDGNWISHTLKDLTKINQGLQIPISERYTEKVENSFFYITNEFLRSNSERSYYIKNPPENVRCKVEDVLMTRTGNTGQVVTGVTGAFHNNFFKIQFDRKILNKDFLVYFLRLPDTQRIIISYAGASTIPDLNHSDFYRILIKIPSPKEQQKIASCLSSLDEIIKAQEDKIEQLKQHKRGLMQGLFPKIEN
jgi:type I restriction enzyme S subunit